MSIHKCQWMNGNNFTDTCERIVTFNTFPKAKIRNLLYHANGKIKYSVNPLIAQNEFLISLTNSCPTLFHFQFCFQLFWLFFENCWRQFLDSKIFNWKMFTVKNENFRRHLIETEVDKKDNITELFIDFF